MPLIEHEAEIDVRAPARVAFGVVSGDILEVDDRPDSVSGHRPLDAGPLRVGFRWQQTLVHERHVCRTDWTVTDLEDARLLKQSFAHMCSVSRAFHDGGETWEFVPAPDGSTQVKLRAWRKGRGLQGWLERIFGARDGREWGLSLRKRLNHVQFEAERRAATS